MIPAAAEFLWQLNGSSVRETPMQLPMIGYYMLWFGCVRELSVCLHTLLTCKSDTAQSALWIQLRSWTVIFISVRRVRPDADQRFPIGRVPTDGGTDYALTSLSSRTNATGRFEAAFSMAVWSFNYVMSSRLVSGRNAVAGFQLCHRLLSER